MIQALHTRTYIIGGKKNQSAVKASAYRNGCSVVAAACYRANDKIKSEIDGRTHDYTRKKGVVFSQIFSPSNAPDTFKNRSVLWNTVERMELAVRKDAQFARQWEASFPPEFSREDQIALASKFAQDYFVSQGMIADVAIHDKPDRFGDRNVHVHVLLTLRHVNENGFIGNKYRIWNNPKFAELWRVSWAERCNEIYKKMELPARIDPRRYELQGNGLIPTKPIGKAANQLEKRGISTPAGDKNRAIMEQNKKTMQNTLYNVMISQENEALNTVEREIDDAEESTLTQDEQKRLITRTEGTIRELKEEREELEEFKTIIGNFQSQIQHFQSAGMKREVETVEQSLREALGNLVKTYPELEDLISGEADPLSVLEIQISGQGVEIERYEKFLDDIRGEEKEPTNVIKYDFNREAERAQEILRDEEIDREKERNR